MLQLPLQLFGELMFLGDKNQAGEEVGKLNWFIARQLPAEPLQYALQLVQFLFGMVRCCGELLRFGNIGLQVDHEKREIIFGRKMTSPTASAATAASNTAAAEISFTFLMAG